MKKQRKNKQTQTMKKTKKNNAEEVSCNLIIVITSFVLQVSEKQDVIILTINKAIIALQMIFIYEDVPSPLKRFQTSILQQIIHMPGVRDTILKATQKTRLSENHEVAFIFIYL